MQVKNKTTRLTAFTLLELIVAIALMDVIAVALYSSMYTAFRAKETSQTVIKPYQYITPAFEFIRNDLVSAMAPDGIMAGVFEGENVSAQGDLDADTLSFYTCSYLPDDDELSSNIVNVAYVLETDTEQDEIVLKRLITTNILASNTLDPDEEIIARDIVGLDIQYYDGSSSDWVEEWDSSVQDSQLPWGVKVTLSIYEEEKTRSSEDAYRDFTRIFMLPTANQSTDGSTETGGAEALR